MSDARNHYERWLAYPQLDEASRQELAAIAGDPAAIEDRFFSLLPFGTAGLRGIMGAGRYRMNRYVVRAATQALADTLKQAGRTTKGVYIACDSRHNSAEFALDAACVLAANGLTAYLFDDIRPTPVLSFAVLRYGADGAINITASHNPKAYNGYKVFGPDGIQLSPQEADLVADRLNRMDLFDDVRIITPQEAQQAGLLQYVGPQIDADYTAAVLASAVDRQVVREQADMPLVYSPYHGAGYKLVPAVLGQLGLQAVHTVPQQMIPDGSFPTVQSPNPEEPEGFAMGIALAEQTGAAAVIANDPDADRIGLAARKADGSFFIFTGNQIGVLLLDYIIKAKKRTGTWPANPLVVTTVVSTRLVGAICARHNITLRETLTGFKFIGEESAAAQQNGQQFIFGFEESHGYLAGTHARDKDGVQAAMLIAEMACYYRKNGMTLHDALMALFEEYGASAEKTCNLYMAGLDGLARMKQVNQSLRAQPPQQIGGLPVAAMVDYQAGTRLVLATQQLQTLPLPKADLITFEMANGASLLVRPSGTEPKIKLYALACAPSQPQAAALAQQLADGGTALING